MFKLDHKQFGFIFKNNMCHTDVNKPEDFEQWNKKTKQLLGRELEACFLEVTA